MIDRALPGSIALACGILLLAVAAAPAGAQPTPAATRYSAVSAAGDSVRAINAPATTFPSAAASASATRFSFISYGDTRGRFDGERLQEGHSLVVNAMLRTIASRATGPDPIRFVLSSGDAVVDGRSAAQWNASFVDVVGRLVTQGDVPVFPAVGNHDVAHTSVRTSPDRLRGLGHFFAAFQHFIPPEGSPFRLAGYPTYAVQYGNTFVLALDSNIADDSVQYDWVSGQLSRLDRTRFPHVVVSLHHPAYSSGPHGAAIVEPQAAAMRARYMPLFRRYHVELVLAGHEHFFEHWTERYRDQGGQARRLDEIVSGGGGAPPYGYRGEPDLRDYARAGGSDSVRVEHLIRPNLNAWENPFHFIVVHVDGARLRVEYVGVDAGADFQPYRSRTVDIEPASRP